MKIFHILLLFTFFSFLCCRFKGPAPNTNSGYPYKPVENITSDDFVFHGLVAGNTSNSFKLGFTAATVTNFPALNGLGISAVHVDIDKGGLSPMHTHPGIFLRR